MQMCTCATVNEEREVWVLVGYIYHVMDKEHRIGGNRPFRDFELKLVRFFLFLLLLGLLLTIRH